MARHGAAAERLLYISLMVFSPFQPHRPWEKRRRFRHIPVRTLVPNLITLLALCAGLTAIPLSAESVRNRS